MTLAAHTRAGACKAKTIGNLEMADFGRIHVEFHKHPKVELAGLEAIGLWAVCNSYSRDQRTRGFIEDSVVARFDPEHQAAKRLVEARLWLRDDKRGGYVFNDWADWNSDEEPKTAAARLVNEIIVGHPNEVMQKLQDHVSDLLIEGVEWSVVKSTLKLWLTKDHAPPSWLPMLVSDVLRQRSDGELVQALRQAWSMGSPVPLARYGFVFTAPNIPREVKGEQVTVFMREAVRKWVEQIREERGIH